MAFSSAPSWAQDGDDCRLACQRRAQRFLEECRAAGGENCEARAEEVEAACIAANCEEPPPPPEPTCEERCHALGAEVFERCRAEGGGPDLCESRAREAISNCIRENCIEPPPPDPTCEERCEERANAVYNECIAAGGDRESCAARRRVAFESCIVDLCNVPPPEPTCEDRCEHRANEEYEACIAAGIGEDECAARRRRSIAECIEHECRDQPPPESDCEGSCEERAARVFRECTAAGIAEEECRARAHRAFEGCLAECEGEVPMPPPCEEDCAARGAVTFRNCIAAGGEEADCRALADAVTGLCLERCADDNPCEERCAAAAQIVYTGCRLAGLSDDQCRRLANVVLEACVAGCGEPLPCPEQCAEIAARAVRECLARGGSEEECQARGAEVAEACLARCEGGDRDEPPCDEQPTCEERAEELVARCRREGLSEERCAELRARFLEECMTEMGDVCQHEEMIARSVFQEFRRGDVDQNDVLELTDGIRMLGELFLGDPPSACEDATDVNDDGERNVADPVMLFNHLFRGVATLPEPHGNVGQDPTADDLICSPQPAARSPQPVARSPQPVARSP
jgi:hypothetical protein